MCKCLKVGCFILVFELPFEKQTKSWIAIWKPNVQQSNTRLLLKYQPCLGEGIILPIRWHFVLKFGAEVDEGRRSRHVYPRLLRRPSSTLSIVEGEGCRSISQNTFRCLCLKITFWVDMFFLFNLDLIVKLYYLLLCFSCDITFFMWESGDIP